MLLTTILSVVLISQLCHCILQANVPMLGNPYEKLRHNEVYLTIARYQNPLTNEHIIPGLSITYLHEDSDFPVMECKSDECRGCLQIYLDDYVDQQVNEKLVLDALLTLEYMNLEQDYRHFCENKQKPWTVRDFCYPNLAERKGAGSVLEQYFRSQHMLPICWEEKRSNRNRRYIKHHSETTSEIKVVECFKSGDPIMSMPDSIFMCNVCTAVRILPRNFTPSIIKEIICDPDSDSMCLLGHGKCFQNYNPVMVKRIDNNAKVQTMPFQARMGCNCAVNLNGPLAKYAYS